MEGLLLLPRPIPWVAASHEGVSAFLSVKDRLYLELVSQTWSQRWPQRGTLPSLTKWADSRGVAWGHTRPTRRSLCSSVEPSVPWFLRPTGSPSNTCVH